MRPDVLLFTAPAVAVAIAGLMQLIAINVGLAAGIVTRDLFSVLVVVAIVTTVMATPLLSLWDRWTLQPDENTEVAEPVTR